MTTKTKTKQDTLNAEFLTNDMFDGMDISQAFTKAVIGYAFGVTAFIASFDVSTTLMLLASPAWLQYVVMFATLAILWVAAVKATPYVIDTLYDSGAWVANKTKSLFASAKTKFSDFEMPSFATKH